MAALPSGTVTFRFTDIEGSTARWERYPEAMQVALARHDVLIRAAIRQHDGRVVKTMGDAFHAAFARATDAVGAALDAQRRLQAEPWGEIGPIRVRMALHTGTAEERDGDYYGPPLNRAARLLSAAHGGQILLSEVVVSLVRESLPASVRLLDLGRHRLKDLTESERVSQVVVPDLPSDFPPLTSLDARPHNLPTHPTALLGREHELADVRNLFAEGVRLVTLTGPGGTGKTRLSLQGAAEMLDDFEHGVFLVELAPITDPALVAPTIAQVLGVPDAGNRPVLEALRDFLRGRTLLLVLDNFEQVVVAAPIVADLLAASPGLAVLATSREPLRVRGEREYAVPPLEIPDLRQSTPLEALSRNAAVALFVERAVAVRPDFVLSTANAGAIAEICACLDGLPLAIELAAARIRLLTPQALLSRLERRLPLLTHGAQDLPARQRTLRNTIAWSYEHLDDAERRVFRRLAVFVGGFSLEAAETVCAEDAEPEADTLDGIDSLVTKSLLRRVEGPGGEPRFGMLETIREYALEQLEASGEADATRPVHAAFFLALAEEGDLKLHGAEQIAWLGRLGAEHDNLRAALAWSRASIGPDLMLRLAGRLAWFWYVSGRLAEGRRWLAEALAAASGGATLDRVRALNGAAALAENQSDYRAADALMQESLAMARRLGDQAGVAWSLALRGLMARNRGQYDRARDALEESLSLWRTHGEEWGIRVSLVWLGSVARYWGDAGRARALLEEGLASCRQAGDKVIACRALMHLGAITNLQGDPHRAEALAEECLALCREIGSTWGIATSLVLLADVVCARGDARRGTALGLEGLAGFRDVGDKRSITRALHVLGRAATLHGDHGRTARLFGAEAGLREATGVPVSPEEHPSHDRDRAIARAGLGDDAFETAWAEGRAMTLEQAVAYALEGSDLT